MQNKEVVDQKIGQLAELMKNPSGNEDLASQILLHLFQLTDEGRELSPDTTKLVKKAACFILSPELRAVLVKLRLGFFIFHFAALSLTDIVDVTDDLSDSCEILKGIHSFPPGAVNKLKRELLGPHQQNSLNKSSMVSASPSPSEIKKTNKEQPDGDLQEDNSLLPSLEIHFLPTNKKKIIESPEEIANSNQLATVSSCFEGKNTLKKGADSSNEKVNESTALPLKKRKLENETVLPSTSRLRHSAPVDNIPLNIPKIKLETETREIASPSTSRHQSAAIGNIPLNIPIEKRFAEKLRDRCQLVEKHTNGIQLYTIPLSKKPATRSSQADRYVFGRRNKAKVECKTILLMGATGSGKTTLINSMVNYILGVEFEDPFRFVLIKEEGSTSSPIDQAESQTSKVTAYELQYQVGFRIPYSLIIVDTPGYGDTKGIERDREITDSIEQFFKDKKGIQVSKYLKYKYLYLLNNYMLILLIIQELDSVGFTVQAPLARLTATQKYIFESILSIFGNDVKDNISFLVTFTDGRTPPVLDAIKAANIANQLDTQGYPRHHRFNNSGFFSSNQDEEDILSATFWKMGIKSFDSFFSSLSSMLTRSLTLTTEVLAERKHINVTVEGLTHKVHKQLTKMEELRKTKQMISNHKDQIDANKDFKYTVTVSRGTKVDITDGKCTTNCSKCSMSCHFPCGLAITDDKRKCAAMGKDDGLCKTCPLKCKWDLHLNQNYHWIFQDVTESRTYTEILKKYEDAFQRKLSTEGVLHSLESELEQIKYDLKSDINTITVCLQRLDQIALRPDALFTATDYIQLMILSEMKEKKPGFQERISSLDSLLERAKMVKKIRAGESVLLEAGAAADQSRSQSRVTIEPQLPMAQRTPIDWSKGMLNRAQQYTQW